MQLANTYGICKYRRLWLCSPRMEHVLELIGEGRAGYVTAMGMGGVFLALLALFLFIAALGKAYRFGKLRGRGKEAPARGDVLSPAEREHPGGELAAVLAVAVALSGRGRQTGVSIPPGGGEEPSPWKTAGRLSMMRPFVRSKKD
jgi:Na+-transporting methylmalonyl-CoA/oxaloacetate decarboxylase gamma subunit